MIIDNLKNANLYYKFNPKLKLAFEYLQKTDFEKMDTGKHEIDGSKIFALVQQYETKSMEQVSWEAHRKYVDIQYIYSGYEVMGYSYIDNLKIVKEYDEIGDYMFLEGEGSFFKIAEGYFTVFYPEDAHMPAIADTAPERVKKVVVKVAVE